MLHAAGIALLVPHAGPMCLLDRVIHWDGAGIRCGARSHLHPDNPLRLAGRLGAVCGLEYALQAAALHGALLAGGAPQPAGYAAVLRDVVLHADRLDDPGHGELQVEALLERQEAGGMAYVLRVATEGGAPLATGRALVALPRPGASDAP